MPIRALKAPHGAPDQLDPFVLDTKSAATSWGRHNRIVVLAAEDSAHITAREDMRGLPASTDAQRRKVLAGEQRKHPKGTRLVYLGSAARGSSIEHRYRWTAEERGPAGGRLALSGIPQMFRSGSRWEIRRESDWPAGADAWPSGPMLVVQACSETVTFSSQGRTLVFELPRARHLLEWRAGYLKFRDRLLRGRVFELTQIADTGAVVSLSGSNSPGPTRTLDDAFASG